MANLCLGVWFCFKTGLTGLWLTWYLLCRPSWPPLSADIKDMSHDAQSKFSFVRHYQSLPVRHFTLATGYSHLPPTSQSWEVSLHSSMSPFWLQGFQTWKGSQGKMQGWQGSIRPAGSEENTQQQTQHLDGAWPPGKMRLRRSEQKAQVNTEWTKGFYGEGMRGLGGDTGATRSRRERSILCQTHNFIFAKYKFYLLSIFFIELYFFSIPLSSSPFSFYPLSWFPCS